MKMNCVIKNTRSLTEMKRIEIQTPSLIYPLTYFAVLKIAIIEFRIYQTNCARYFCVTVATEE